MMRALMLAAGAAAAGYALGSKSGRGTYKKMMGQSADLWHNAGVQDKVSEASKVVKETVPHVQETVGALAKKAGQRTGIKS
ncbi:hypothetical protein ACWDTG_13955 [Rhodococcus zopfii]|uniref:YtxH domain-containing protein n=2 Tax=Rhodococcus zopfii TaxID=43772 RepID=A0ABU3WPL6_9NOCA|nr:hypothetical protein [Rhodococcus zopfii]MDV2475932.1 hypothetical protein [Rhodococcus zopfii]